MVSVEVPTEVVMGTVSTRVVTPLGRELEDRFSQYASPFICF